MQLGEVFFDKTLAKSPSAAPAPFSFSFSLVIVNVIHFLYQLEVNEVSMNRLFVSIYDFIYIFQMFLSFSCDRPLNRLLCQMPLKKSL